MSTTRRPIPRAVHRQVIDRYGLDCWLGFPGCEGRADTLDHIMPHSLGGTDTAKNLRPACRHCNGARADRLIQHHGIDVTIHVGAPDIGRIRSDGRVLDFEAVLDIVRGAQGLDDDAWTVAETMWQAGANRLTRRPSRTPVVLAPPATLSVKRWREWHALGYRIIVDDTVPQRDTRCRAEHDAWLTWMRGGLTAYGVGVADERRDAKWRALGLAF